MVRGRLCPRTTAETQDDIINAQWPIRELSEENRKEVESSRKNLIDLFSQTKDDQVILIRLLKRLTIIID